MAKLRDLIGIIKDKASQSKAALLSKPTTLSLLRATSHDSFTPPSRKHLFTLLSFGDGSRATASAAIDLLMDRLQTTHNSAVALKCLIAVHHVIKHGSFILQDQLSVFPSFGGRNYLKLSNFRDNSNPINWELSSWVRWYAGYIEQLLCTFRDLGFFLGASSSGTAESRESQEERVCGLMNGDLLRESESLLTLVEEICKRPDPETTKGNKLAEEIVNLVGDDWISGISEMVWVRVNEFRERVDCLSFGEAVELECLMKRMEESRERMMEMLTEKSFWGLVRELKEKAGMEAYSEEGKLCKTVKRHRGFQSERFSGRSVLNSADSPRFPSGRLL